MKCEKCGDEYAQTEISHDIPRYLGGFDCDGRHCLCKDCHDRYDRTILARCFLKFFNQTIPFYDEKGYGKYMGIVKNSPYARKCYYVAWEVKKEWWGEDDSI